MIDWTSGLMTAAIQVTAVALPAIVLVLLVGRRNPAIAASTAAIALLVTAALTVAAFAPLPTRWTWAVESATAQPRDTETVVSNASTPTGARWDVRQLLSQLSVSADGQPAARWSGRDLAAVIVAGISGLSAVGWLYGLLMAWRLRRGSQPIEDVGLSALADQIRRDSGIVQPIEIRESKDIGSAATCGHRRPAILLSADWRNWQSADLRAVLAHELAHIRRRDFGWAVLARACLAINACHPLVRWLASRLRLAQELAADQWAAGCVGGQTLYRQSLARMALRQDRLHSLGMVPSFGSNRSTLIRRMAMLNIHNGGRTGTRAIRWVTLGLLVAIGFTASALRGPAQAPSPPAEPAKLPAFDLGYLPEKCDGFVAIRPGLLLGRPEMKPVVAQYTKLVDAAFRQYGISAGAIPFDAIEQIVGPIEFKRDPNAPKGQQNSISMGIQYVRMTRDFDWSAIARSLPKSIPVTEKEPGVFEFTAPMFSKDPMPLRTIDARTIVCNSTTAEEAAARRAELAERFGAALLAQANRGGMAIVIDNTSAFWTEAVESDPKVGAVVTALGKPNRLAFCLNWSECVAASFIADWDNPPADVAKGQQTVCALLGAALSAAKPTDASDQKVVALASELLKSIQVRRDGNLVRADFRSSVRWPDLIGSLKSNSTAKVEVRDDQAK